ncbi:hypothetical protein IEQ34_014768 [Dendrobium chrysotoxum]|uniref:Uncharacterized protein n=1 Tax=Dendrobium chrysotoxum TaxID=161865 RepID=A0AAV7GL47_DENCH|nr:hypothetical protein IEQ34_014768 [Dendrobium chrysotoxum]
MKFREEEIQVITIEEKYEAEDSRSQLFKNVSFVHGVVSSSRHHRRFGYAPKSRNEISAVVTPDTYCDCLSCQTGKLSTPYAAPYSGTMQECCRNLH